MATRSGRFGKATGLVLFALLAVAASPFAMASSLAMEPTPEVSPAPSDTSAADRNPDVSLDTRADTTIASAATAESGGWSPAKAASMVSATISTFSGSATSRIPIQVPPGRNGIAPNLALTYSSSRGNGWIGVGWNLDMGAIQRSTKFGVNYNADDYVASANGSTAELVALGGNYFAAKIEGAFLRYFYDSSNRGWVVTAKNGTKYYYGSTSASRQDNGNVNTIFKWCLDKVQDTNGNYMTISYVKDFQGEIYLDRIDYAGNSGLLSPTNYVKFYRNDRIDAWDIYVPNFRVNTAKRLTTIDVFGGGTRAWVYELDYSPSPNTKRSLLTRLRQFGDDAVVSPNGEITGGTFLPPVTFGWETTGNGLTVPAYDNYALPTTIPGGYANRHTGNLMWIGDFNGDGKSDYMWVPYNGDGRMLIAYGTENGFTVPN